MDAQLLGFLLGISVAMIGTLVTALGLSMKNNRVADNPNMVTLDEKLNQILLLLTQIAGKIGGSK